MAEGQSLGLPHGQGTAAFLVGTNDFDQLEIRPAGTDAKLYYFFHRGRRDLIKEFVLETTPRTTKSCEVALIRTDSGKFTPRLTFRIRDRSTRVIESTQLPVVDGETRSVKASVELQSCHEQFWQLVRFLEAFDDIDVPTSSLRVVASAEAQLLEGIRTSSREAVVAALVQGLDSQLTEQDVALLAGRRTALQEFGQLLNDAAYFHERRAQLGPNKRDEDVWQDFFERNEWIFGYGLSLVSCEKLTQEKLEAVVTGADVLGGTGKRIDALMRTRSHIASLLFCEIKTPSAALLMKDPYRAAVFVPAEDLRGGVAQLQKTIHLVTLKATENQKQLVDKFGAPTGDTISLVKPRGVVVVGSLSEFETQRGVNLERLSSFELYRGSLHGVEIVTFDELFERARFIVGHYLREDESS